MRNHIIKLLASGSVAMAFMVALALFAKFSTITEALLAICLSGCSISTLVCFCALIKLARNGHLMTDVNLLLKMR